MPAEEEEIDTRMLVNSGNDEDGEPNLRPWLSLKKDTAEGEPAKDNRRR